jgi:hypothetical protein
MKRVVRFQILAAILGIAMMSVAGCGKDNGGDDPDDPNVPGGSTAGLFKIKQATVVYDVLEGMKKNTLYFDDNGKKMRIDEEYETFDLPGTIYILDEVAGKAYKLNVGSKTYEEVTVASLMNERRTHFFDETSYTSNKFPSTTEVIAGKSCKVFTITSSGHTAIYGGWNDIMFLMGLDDGDVYRALSFSETIPANIFTIPSDYTKK